MSFRRIPFQFSTIDPADRQRELEKRFGVPAENKMYVDAANPFQMGSGFNTSTSSPRFQHRVPMFVDGMPAQSSVDSLGCENKSPKVRVIPIQIEKDDSSPSSRHRTFSGPAVIPKHQNKEMCSQKDDASTLKRSMEDLTKPSKMKAASGPKVYNIPIKVEKSGVREKKSKSEKRKMPEVNLHSEVNGSDIPKHSPTIEPELTPKEKEADLIEEHRTKININNSLKKIDSVMEELKSYETGVNEFNGTAKDKQYRYLDEMLTRCMIKLDDIETMGNEEVRSARKKVVKMVQACIDLLENKVNIANNPDTLIGVIGNQDNTEQHPVLQENAIEIGEKSEIVDSLEENLLVTNDESKLPQSETLTQKGMHESSSACEPEVEMVNVTSSSDVNEKTGIDNSVTDHSLSDVTNAISDEELRQPSSTNEMEMSEDNLQDQNDLPKPEVSSTNILELENVPVDPAQMNDLNEADMIDVSSMCYSSTENQKSEAIPQVSSSNLQSEAVPSNFEQFPVETVVFKQCETVKNVKTQEADSNSNCDSNVISNIPEVEMKEVDEHSCKTDNITLDEIKEIDEHSCKTGNTTLDDNLCD